VSAAAPVSEKQIDLVDVDMGVFSLSAVLDNAVVNGVQHHQQAHRFQIFTQVLNVKAENAAFCVDIGLVGKYIQTTHCEQLQCQRDPVRLRVDLLHQVIIEIFQRRRLALIVFQIFPVDVAHATVDDGLLLRLDLVRAHELFIQRHDKLGLHHQRLLAVAIPLGQVQRIDVTAVWVRGRNGDDLAAQRSDQLTIFAFGIDNNNVMVGRECQRCHFLLCRHAFAGAGHPGDEAVAVQKVSTIADDEVMGHGVDAIVDAARVLNLLRFEGHENGSTFRGQSAGSFNAFQTEGQHRVQRVLLLVAQNVKLTAPRPPDGLQGFGVLVKLFEVICQVCQRHQSQHHALVAAHEVVHKLLCFAPHLLQVIGNIGGKIVVLILPLLPAGNIRFHGHNALANIAHRFVHRHRDNVDGKHHVSGIVHQLRDHLIGNKAGILPQEQGTAHMIAQLIVIFLKGNTVRSDAVPEVMSPSHGVLQIEPE